MQYAKLRFIHIFLNSILLLFKQQVENDFNEKTNVCKTSTTKIYHLLLFRSVRDLTKLSGYPRSNVKTSCFIKS